MPQIIKILILSSYLVLGTHANAEQLMTTNAALQAVFPRASEFLVQAITLTAQQKMGLDAACGRESLSPYSLRIQAFNGTGQGRKPVGIAWVADDLGKHQPISYLVALDTKQKIVGLELLVYREMYGDGVRSARFREQFKGKGRGDALTVGKDIDAVSGATISSKTLAFGARRALYLEDLIGRPQPKHGEKK